jgi:hypothetical protein
VHGQQVHSGGTHAGTANPGVGRVRDRLAGRHQVGVTVLFGDDVYRIHDPATGEGSVSHFPWHLTLDALEQQVDG